jgi:PAS domain S-box-containing protein
MNNPYALLPLFNAIVSIALIATVLRQSRHDALTFSFIAYATALATWSFIQHLQWAYVSDQWMVTVMKIDSIAWLSVVFHFLGFTYRLLKKRRGLIYYSLLVTTMLAVILSVFTDLVIAGFERYHWGTSEIYGPLFEPIGYLVITLPALYLIIIMTRATLTAEDRDLKLQYRLVLVGSVFSAIFAITTDFVIPVILGDSDFINLGSTGFLVQAIFLYIAITRYKLLDIDVDIVAADLFNSLHEAILIVDRNGWVVRINPAARQLFGITSPTGDFILIHKILPTLFDHGTGIDLYETEIDDDEQKTIASVSRLEVVRHGRKLGEVISLRDVTPIHEANEFLRQANEELQNEIRERQHSETLLRGSEDRFRTLIEEGSDVVVILDRNHRYTYASPTVRLTGYQPEQVIGGHISAFVSPEDLPAFLEALDEAAARPDEIITTSDFRITRADSSTALFEGVLINKLDHPGIEGIIFNGRDVTDRVRTHEILMASQKLADLGTLSAGVAHEINSPLQVITGLSERYLRQFAGKGLQTDLLERDFSVINRNAWRIARIVRSLLSYSRSTTGDVALHDLNEIIEDSLLLIEHQFKSWSNIDIIKTLANELPLVNCDHNSITQVLINLLTNAADAMPDGGTITITTRHETDADQVLLSVSDTGEGISAEARERIFDPFFTTKPVGEGTGLGLSIVMGTVSGLGGEVSVESGLAGGTIMTIHLPLNAPLPQPPQDDSSRYGNFA